MQKVYNIASSRAMMKMGQQLARSCIEAETSQCVIYLQGELGAGKTTLTRGFLRAFGYMQAVKSPSYTIVEPYKINAFTIYHFDLYRLKSAEELAYIGAREYFSEKAICLVEWPEYGAGFIPQADIKCMFTIDEKISDKRLVTVEDNSIMGHLIMQNLLKLP